MSITLFIILLVAAIVIYILLLINRGKTKRKAMKTDSLYTTGLNYMLHNENQKAIESLREYLKYNTRNIDAYIKLGDLLRKTGQAKNALNIHENLLFRQDITKDQQITILTQLCEDNMALENYSDAIEKAKEILKQDKHNRYANENLYKLYRDAHQWENAIDALKKNHKIDEATKKRLMTIYRVQDGLENYYNSGKYHDARLVFRKAIKFDPGCEVPYYYMGLSYIKDQREEDAVDWWEKFVEINPEKAYLVFPDLKKILFNLGKFERINTFLRNILKKSPKNTETIIALAEFYENKGEISQAIAIIDEHLKSQKNDTELRISLAKFYAVKENCRKSAGILADILNNYNLPDITKCSNCGHEVDEPTWLCNNCKETDTFID
ncbi:MAG: tetratricopeptide repeat protein [Fidelibacterota bacterium]